MEGLVGNITNDDFFYGDKITIKKNHYIGGAISLH